MRSSQIEELLKGVPARPGIYLMRDEQGNVLYVGKAASLHHRLPAYFGSTNDSSPKLQRMMARVADFEFIVTDSEQEALILECNLIKRHRPRYNVRLKDDKNYPYIKINPQEDWARVYITRRFENDGARYFGPFASARSMRQTLDLIKKLFPYRSCNRTITGTDPRPCLDYYIHRCVGPCIGAVSKEEYRGVINQVILFLEGRQERVLRELRARMQEASQGLEFERAAVLRDQIRAVERVTERQKISSTLRGDQDVIAFDRGQDEACVQVFFVRGGKLIGRENFMLEGTQDEAPEQIMSSFLEQFYDSSPYIPTQILLQHPPQDSRVVAEWLTKKRGAKVTLLVPRRGEKKKLVDMVAENAHQELNQLRIRWLADSDRTLSALEELREQLNLPSSPKRIECYDISDIQGTSAVGSMVVFENGQPKPPHYRRFRIKAVAGANDYAMLQEVLRRRFKRNAALEQYRAALIREETPAEAPTAPPGNGAKPGPWAITPDLVIVDGGKGQLNAALEVMDELDARFIPVIGLAKEKEEIFVPEMPESILLPRSSQSLYLVQRIRDEAHRFALAYHQKVRQQRAFTSSIDSIAGIGPKRKRALLRRFGSIKAIREATIDEIAAVPGLTRSLAEKVKEYL